MPPPFVAGVPYLDVFRWGLCSIDLLMWGIPSFWCGYVGVVMGVVTWGPNSVYFGYLGGLVGVFGWLSVGVCDAG